MILFDSAVILLDFHVKVAYEVFDFNIYFDYFKCKSCTFLWNRLFAPFERSELKLFNFK